MRPINPRWPVNLQGGLRGRAGAVDLRGLRGPGRPHHRAVRGAEGLRPTDVAGRDGGGVQVQQRGWHDKNPIEMGKFIQTNWDFRWLKLTKLRFRLMIVGGYAAAFIY